MSRVLLFGGSFDPVHHGHLIVSRAAAEGLGAAKVILIPSARPPHKPRAELAPAEHRLEMCRLAVQGDPQFAVSDWELRQPGPGYTLHTVRHFQGAFGPDARLYWLIGADSLAELATWYRVGELASECLLVTAGRSGWSQSDLSHLAAILSPEQLDEIRRHILDTPAVDISATDLRARVRAGRSIRFLVPEAVERYILEHQLYAGGGPFRRGCTC